MLLNEFLKEHKTVQEQGAMIARQQKTSRPLIRDTEAYAVPSLSVLLG